MFHTIITLAYIIPNIYVFLRVWYLFINKGYKLYYLIVYIFLASIYPVSNLFSEDSAGLLATVFNEIGKYILPFYLYIFLSLLTLDVFLLINSFLRIISAEMMKNTKLKFTLLSAIIIFSLAVVIAGIINFNTIRTSEYQIEIQENLHGLNI